MIHVPSRLPGESFSLYHLEETMKPLGYVINGNWDYDHGYFDYKIDNRDGYTFLRVPFTAEKGQLDQPGVVVKLGDPFLLKHVYQDKLD
ncbi:YugN family protein, partial [Bacillus pumilus]